MAETDKIPRAPDGMGARGRRLWRRIAKEYELRAHELEVLELACRSLDRVQALQDALQNEPATVAGSRKQPRPNPLYAEIRAESLLASRLLRDVGIPAEEAEPYGAYESMTQSQRARKAALARHRGRGSVAHG